MLKLAFDLANVEMGGAALLIGDPGDEDMEDLVGICLEGQSLPPLHNRDMLLVARERPFHVPALRASAGLSGRFTHVVLIVSKVI
jgi:hypothetical protein